ncbi:probable NhaC-type sodium/proton antiporter [Natronomonas pharaonis DSM 2160]|uniref:Probable NhaC-type sodium/proton antiporter n=1 Tax=Natronomonas pharaonis (strain ATCC 35678 / DSM 2160 / CIP 103997 / JCM 8858 / NBRC 14720 / NCIMB 2260 / Gabara) TaxID=348780 RepID=A0A1U7EVG0_NATPD|nr:Na+/H+ antiporter NhaC family protein [Natronomonas pharaonis]CAI49007.1 probable NhaC-type sodium/proton antiporter [Natronomonas pharaonis DSM 2160]
MSEFGALSLIPPLFAIALALVTRKAVLSLFLGIWSGGIIYVGGPNPRADPTGWVHAVVADGFGLFTTFDWIVMAIIADDGFHAQILLFLLLIGSGVAMVWTLGGAYAVRDWALRRLDTPRKGMLATWVLGLLLFFDDYANTAIVGSTMKDVSDQLQVSREKLSYVVDSTAAPVSTVLLSSWVAFQIGLIDDAYGRLGLTGEDAPSAFEVFLSSIPFNMYAILAIAMVGIIVVTGRDYGEMLTAERRAWRTGKVYRDGARPMQDAEAGLGEPAADTHRLSSFFVPVVVLIVVTLGAALYTGYLAAGADLTGMVIEGDYTAALIYGSFAMVASGFLLGKFHGILDVGASTDTTINGFGIMLTAVTILVLAWGIGTAVGTLGTGEYVSGFAEAVLNPAVLPAVVFAIAAVIAFATGTSWGAMTILTPIVIPVAWELTGSHEMTAAVVGMVFSGTVLGDHTSPISDTSVLSSTFTGADLIDHVRTQLYYALTVGVVVVALILVWGLTGISPLLLLPVGVLALVGLVYALSEFDARRRGVSPVAVREASEVNQPVKPPIGGQTADDEKQTADD